MKIDILTGKSQDHLVSCGSHLIHGDVLSPFNQLQEKAKKKGFDLQIASSYRSFERQLTIWNEKAQGLRPLLDENEKNIDINLLTNEELLFSILRWTALPGTSRHHWGTDFDIYDKAALPSPDYQVELTQYEADHYFGKLHAWLDQNSGDFFRPYDGRSGIYTERWHLSYAPVAQIYKKNLTREIILTTISNSKILLKKEILGNLDQIFENYC